MLLQGGHLLSFPASVFELVRFPVRWSAAPDVFGMSKQNDDPLSGPALRNYSACHSRRARRGKTLSLSLFVKEARETLANIHAWTRKECDQRRASIAKQYRHKYLVIQLSTLRDHLHDPNCNKFFYEFTIVQLVKNFTPVSPVLIQNKKLRHVRLPARTFTQLSTLHAADAVERWRAYSAASRAFYFRSRETPGALRTIYVGQSAIKKRARMGTCCSAA
jgi:hypothetical protein